MRRRTLNRFGLLLAGVVASSTAAASASARPAFYPTDPAYQTNATLAVGSTAKVSKNGGAVTWRVRFSCPAGEAFSSSALLSERNPASIPALLGEDQGINAVPEPQVSGVCTGRTQRLTLRLVTQETTWTGRCHVDETGENWVCDEGGTGYYPIHPSRATNAVFSIEGDGFFALYCAAPACADTTGPAVVLR